MHTNNCMHPQLSDFRKSGARHPVSVRLVLKQVGHLAPSVGNCFISRMYICMSTFALFQCWFRQDIASDMPAYVLHHTQSLVLLYFWPYHHVVFKCYMSYELRY